MPAGSRDGSRAAAPQDAAAALSLATAGGTRSAWALAAALIGVAGAMALAWRIARRSPRWKLLGRAAWSLPIVAGAIVLSPVLMTGATNSLAVFKSPSAANLWVGGQPLTIDEEVAPVGSPGLGSFDLVVNYDPSVLAITVAEGPFLGSTGNATACSTSYPVNGHLRFSCAATGSPASGPTGRGTVAIFTILPQHALILRPTTGNGILTVLDDAAGSITMRDVTGANLPLAAVGDAIIAVRALEGDLNKDCIVNVIDDQMIASHYPATFGVLLYSSWFDLEPTHSDGDIDIKDLQFVFGRNGSTCDHPVPTQTPPSGETPTIPPTSTITNTPTPTMTATQTATPTHTPTATSTVSTATKTPTRTATATGTVTGTRTASVTPSVTGTPTTVGEGCTPGFWKNHPDIWPAPYKPSQTVGSVFSGVDLSLANKTLSDALGFGGGAGVVGAQEILLRAAVAALLNAANDEIDYPLTPAEVIAQVNAALATGNRDTILELASKLDGYNNLGCPINAFGTPTGPTATATRVNIVSPLERTAVPRGTTPTGLPSSGGPSAGATRHMWGGVIALAVAGVMLAAAGATQRRLVASRRRRSGSP